MAQNSLHTSPAAPPRMVHDFFVADHYFNTKPLMFEPGSLTYHLLELLDTLRPGELLDFFRNLLPLDEHGWLWSNSSHIGFHQDDGSLHGKNHKPIFWKALVTGADFHVRQAVEPVLPISNPFKDGTHKSIFWKALASARDFHSYSASAITDSESYLTTVLEAESLASELEREQSTLWDWSGWQSSNHEYGATNLCGNASAIFGNVYNMFDPSQFWTAIRSDFLSTMDEYVRRLPSKFFGGGKGKGKKFKKLFRRFRKMSNTLAACSLVGL